MAWGSLVEEVANGTDQLASRELVTAKVVNEEFSTCSLSDVELCADTVLFPVGTSSGLELGNFIPKSRVFVSSKVGRGGRELALTSRGDFH